MNKVLVIGGTGFIGSNIIKYLREKGIYTGCYGLTNSGIGDTNYIGNILYDDNLEYIVSQYDQIIYLITSVSPKRSMEQPIEPYANDIPLLIKTLEAAKKNNIKRVVFASSGGTIYGNIGNRKAVETDFNNPINHYGICKLSSEKILEMYNILYGMENISLRISNPYGFGQRVSSNVGAVTVFANKILNGEEITIYGDGNAVRDYVDVEDVAQAFYLALEYKFNPQHNPQIYNIGSSSGINLNELIKIISDELGIQPVVKYYDTRGFDVGYNVLDISKAQNILGYCPEKNQTDKIREYVRNIEKMVGKTR